MARTLGEKEEIVDVISRKRFSLLTSHFIQTSYDQILEHLATGATKNFDCDERDKVTRENAWCDASCDSLLG
jgi:hypothetical protein